MWRRVDGTAERRAREAAATAGAGRTVGDPPGPGESGRPDNPHVLPCPLIVLHTTTDGETGRPLSELLRALGYV